MCHFASPIIDPLPRPGAFASHAVTATTQAPIRRSDFGAADDISLHRVIGARLEGRAHPRRYARQRPLAAEPYGSAQI